jgi:hypothetical protein
MFPCKERQDFYGVEEAERILQLTHTAAHTADVLRA